MTPTDDHEYRRRYDRRRQVYRGDAFKVDDVDDKLVSLNALTVTATSSNLDLVPNNPANIVLGGTLGSRTIQLKPLANQSGATTITVTVTDSSGDATEDISC